MQIVEYYSNNSGGNWWLSDKNWFDLEKAGWKVEWEKDKSHDFFRIDAEGRWLGALSIRASREGLSLADAIKEWETITGQNANDQGCECCGGPHSFYETEKRN